MGRVTVTDHMGADHMRVRQLQVSERQSLGQRPVVFILPTLPPLRSLARPRETARSPIASSRRRWLALDTSCQPAPTYPGTFSTCILRAWCVSSRPRRENFKVLNIRFKAYIFSGLSPCKTAPQLFRYARHKPLLYTHRVPRSQSFGGWIYPAQTLIVARHVDAFLTSRIASLLIPVLTDRQRQHFRAGGPRFSPASGHPPPSLTCGRTLVLSPHVILATSRCRYLQGVRSESSCSRCDLSDHAVSRPGVARPVTSSWLHSSTPEAWASTAAPSQACLQVTVQCA